MAVAEGALLAGRYRVVERVGAGGMATVYLAEDERLGRRVAVKRLHAESPEDLARRFEREARLGASLNHPNIVSIYDTATDEGGVLIVMEYVHGPTLGAAMRDGPLGVERALAVIGGVAAALDHIHDRGVVHRDVKPANVLLGEEEVAKLTDLGVATATEGVQITRTGTVLGTPAYMAPEQLEGGALGRAVDVYALAALAYEALGGERARPGRTPMEIAHRAATQPPPDLSAAWADAPPAAAALLKRGMARDPAERPASAGALATELAAAFEPGGPGSDVTGRPPAVALATDASQEESVPDRPASGRREAVTRLLRRDTTVTGRTSRAEPVGPTLDRGQARAPAPHAGPTRSRRRLGALAALVVIGGAAAVALVAARDDPAPTPAPRAATPPVAPRPAPKPSPRTPDQTVGDFYQLTVGKRFHAAWGLAGPGWQSQLLGYQGYRNTFATLEDVEFRRLKTTNEGARTATVAVSTVARHPDKTDRCAGTFSMSRASRRATWKIAQGGVACTPGPASASSGSSAGAGGGGASAGGAASGKKVPKAAKNPKKQPGGSEGGGD